MAITKLQWQQLEIEMARIFVEVVFRYQGHEVAIRRHRTSESATVLVVFIDEEAKEEWVKRTTELPVDAPKILQDVWNVRSMAAYKKADIQKVEKIFGKRRAKKEYPDLHNRMEWLSPYYTKASTLCRRLKKLQGLELVKSSFTLDPA